MFNKSLVGNHLHALSERTWDLAKLTLLLMCNQETLGLGDLAVGMLAWKLPVHSLYQLPYGEDADPLVASQGLNSIGVWMIH